MGDDQPQTVDTPNMLREDVAEYGSNVHLVDPPTLADALSKLQEAINLLKFIVEREGKHQP